MKLKLSMLFLLVGLTGFSQEELTYQKPSKEILDLADYERAPSVSMDTKKEYMLLSYRNTYKTLDELNQEEMRLGGLRINPITNISSTVTYINNLKVRKIKDKNETQVTGLPQNPKISNISWSPDEKKLAFTHTTATGVELWVLDIASAKATRLTEATVNANMGSPYSWYRDNQNLLVRMLPKNRPALIDSKKDLPKGPTVSTSDGSKSQNRTYQDLLKNKTDETNFETLVSSELYKIDLSGKASLYKSADLYAGEGFSPDGNYIMITTIQKPFSYIVPLSRFPMKSVVYDLTGKEIKVVNEVPLSEIMPKGFMATRKGKRSMGWRSDAPATLYFVEALDGGDPANKVDFRDEVFLWQAPFTSNPTSLVKTVQRYGGIVWGNNTTAILYDQWYDTRNEKTYLFNPSNPGQAPKVIFDRNSQDIYSDPGSFETIKNQYGRQVLALENDNAFLVGEGHTKNGQFPFIDEFNIKTFKTKRLYQSAYKDKKESIFSIEDFKKGDVLVQIQSKSEYPNYYFRNIKKKNELTQITNFKNPFESIKNVHKEVIKYKRKDGVELSGTLYLPVGYDMKKKEKLPLLIWAYPEEYKDKNSAGQSSQNPNEFTFPNYGSFVYWVAKGYVVLDDASFPIIGEGSTEPNDTFITQLVDNAAAAIDAVDKLGYINRKKVAVGGHSYGAFMTANLLTHSDLFACGIARSGAYNRTLTPFGFQSEQRNYWEVPEVYNTMSPFMTADKMKTPLLLVHGDADNNPGTFTLQSERYFQALKGLGAPVRLLLLPKESHGYAAKENILHLLWEQDQFLEKHLKN
ncbi:MAG: prolyl oligopeptidase family serine peptidase [Flavobacterium lindanitolerans]|jgi:dipeptidyl aminopeptidase/acylaminoacyl peptidase|uniref:prolyl oligopeptidase family serine peptidase n=1 Tax=Flavobacterium TaxID=237 RepID=UPI0006F64C31|nr:MULTISPECIES: prolyl oligopeptidase family serine peptidase [Flavobacterium]KQS47306.1 aminoacyl peptidase [Flavobacterium sp. Leaf359]MBL7869679.1 prolyl oligopeptidase family serine peptidase [Flavobacterium lindanitolerans]PZQ88866.1 MAG: S9 family peptidase [Flavobacterium johnsoniae]